jgi:hypothetical protein
MCRPTCRVTCRALRRAVGGVLAVHALLSAVGPLAAQDAALLAGRTVASVEYVGADGLYLGVGADQGVVRGDTLAVYASAGAGSPMGRLVFTSVTRRRAVAVAIDPSVRLRAGDVVYLPLAPPAVVDALDPAAAAPLASVRQTTSGRPSGAASGPRISGRLALDLEARETLTSWSGDLFGETRRRFATPTSRLSLLVTDLPGGVAVRANVRASYRYDELAGGPPPVSVRAYELAAVKSFDALPVEITLGRFSNPYERYSAYWDGALLRVGRTSGLGVGAAAGFEPELHNEGFARTLPKLTAFADFAARGTAWRYDTDASFHVARPAGGAERRFVGWSQQLTVGRLSLSQRLRVDGGAGMTRWSLTQLRLRGAVELARPLRLRSTFSRSSSVFPLSLPPAADLPSHVRRELTLGLDLSGGLGHVSVEAGRTERDGDAPGLSLYGSAGVRMAAAQLLLSGRHWAREDTETWSVAPALSLRLSSWDWRAGYRLYRTSDGPRVLTSHSAEGQAGVMLTRGTRVALRGERQWGPNLSGTRVQLSLWRSF